ncbi:SpoIIE family protein phosphatase [Streptomyces sp.]|uniref:SpoIIE family protein phosphatase n=1 Tax=Streptomyces sp. TaxID=1931 RepID=UPI002810F541|nr:SpoIIE family protein phosphatase [Streptomyces sp.]
MDTGTGREDFGRQLLDQIFGGLLREVGAHVGSVYLLDEDRQVLELEVMSGAPPEVAELWGRLRIGVPLPVTDAVRRRTLMWVGSEADMASRYPRAALVLPYPLALAAAPISTSTAVWGAVLLLWPSSRPDVLSSHERERVGAACDRLARLLELMDGAGQRMRPGSRPRSLPQPPAVPGEHVADAGAALLLDRLPGGSCALDRQGRLTYVNSRAVDLLGVPADGLLGARLWEVLPWLQDDPVSEDRYRAALISQETTSFTVLRPPGRQLAFELHPDATGISVRITHLTRTADAVPQPARAAGPSRAGTLYHLMHLAGALTEAVSVRDVVDLVADHILPAYDAQALALLVAENGRLRIVGTHGYSLADRERFDNTPLTAPTPATRALTNGTPSFFASRRQLADSFPEIAGPATNEAWAFLPLIASGRPVGCWLTSYAQPHSFGAEERAALTSLSGLIAQALDRARTYDRQDQVARGLQAALLPHTLPAVPGLEVAARYLPATHGMDIGGDFYDLIRLTDRAAAAVIGDVQGHNVTAAALMGQVRTGVHAHATAGATPDQVLTHTNRLLADLAPELFTSCLYAHLDLARHRVRLATAGHLPPLLRHPDGHTDVLRPEPGLLLGIAPHASYPTLEVPLPPGAVLALYTDGLVEVPGADLDRMLTDLARHLTRTPAKSLDHIADGMLQHARHHTGEHTDDIALLLIRPTAREASDRR